MSDLETSVQNIYNWITPGTWVLVLAAFAVCGVMMIVPSEKAHEAVKKHIAGIAIGSILFIGAATIAKEFISKIAF